MIDLNYHTPDGSEQETYTPSAELQEPPYRICGQNEASKMDFAAKYRPCIEHRVSREKKSPSTRILNIGLYALQVLKHIAVLLSEDKRRLR